MQPRSWLALPLVLLLAAGCCLLPPKTTYDATDYDAMWSAATDVLSSLMQVDQANKQDGRILAHVAGKWERSQAQVTFLKRGRHCEIEVIVHRDRLEELAPAEGVGSREVWLRTGRDTALERRIIRMIGRRASRGKQA